MHALAALESADARDIGAKRIHWVIWIENVDTISGILLGAAVWGEDFDGIIYSRGGDCRFVGVACGM